MAEPPVTFHRRPVCSKRGERISYCEGFRGDVSVFGLGLDLDLDQRKHEGEAVREPRPHVHHLLWRTVIHIVHGQNRPVPAPPHRLGASACTVAHLTTLSK